MLPFAKALHTAVPQPCFGRPFVCDGHPEECHAVVIGENPATEMGVDWWSFWDDAQGFNYTAWIAVYEESREAKGESRTSNTRRRLNRLRAKGIRCLETNVFFNEGLDGPGRGASNTDLLDLVFDTLPSIKWVIAHGRTAQQYLDTRQIPTNIAKVFRTRHFRSESYEVLDRISEKILASHPSRKLPSEDQPLTSQLTRQLRSCVQVQQRAGWIAFLANASAPLSGFGTQRIGKLVHGELQFTIGATRKGRSANLNAAIRSIIEAEGLEVLTRKTTSGSARDKDPYPTVRTDGVPWKIIERILRRVEGAALEAV